MNPGVPVVGFDIHAAMGMAGVGPEALWQTGKYLVQDMVCNREILFDGYKHDLLPDL